MPTQSPPKTTPIASSRLYLPEVDGLRAVAVLAVLFYHAGFGCRGGYVGVDIFFVISGYLITTILWNDLQSGKFRFSQFWERRARRIVPASSVMAIGVLAAGCFLLLPVDLATLGRAAAAQALFGANFFYYLTSSYFAVSAHQKPLLHMWSLAVEEQFYFLMPVAMWAMARLFPSTRRIVIIAVFSVAFVFSLCLGIWGVARNPEVSFYMLPMRGWELLTGSLLAFFPVPVRALGARAAREAAAGLGAVLIIVPIFVYTTSTPFPGLAALPPVLGTALVIWANGRHQGAVPTAVGRALAWAPVVFVGLISYSLYLWHWPFFAFANYLALEPLTVWQRAVLAGLGFGAAVLSWRYVETPFRTKRLAPRRPAMFAWAGTGLTLTLILGIAGFAWSGFPGRFSAERQAIARAAADRGRTDNLSLEDARAGRWVRLGAEKRGVPPAVFLWGDSHAMAALTGFDDYLRHRGLSGIAATHSSTAPVLGWFYESPYGLNAEAEAFGVNVLEYAAARGIRDVVLAGRWDSYIGSSGNRGGAFEDALVGTVRRMKKDGLRPWILLDVPVYEFNVPRALALPIYPPDAVAVRMKGPEEGDALNGRDPAFTRRLMAAGARFLDPKEVMLDPATKKYRLTMSGECLYYDSHHLSGRGSRLVFPVLLVNRVRLGHQTARNPASSYR